MKLRELVFKLCRPQDWRSINDYRSMKFSSIETMALERREKLLALLTHAIENSNFYRSRLKSLDLSDSVSLSTLPFLTKEDIVQHRSEIRSQASIDILNSRENSTSGSSGKSTHFYSDMRDRRGARAARGDEFVEGFRFLDKQLIFWGAERDIIQPRTFKEKFKSAIFQKRVLSTYHMRDCDIRDYIKTIQRFRPSTLVGYPSALHFIAQYIKSKEIDLGHNLDGIISAGELLLDNQREAIEESFGCKVYNRYGSREFGHIASECKAHKGLHYNYEDLIIEIIDAEGKIVQPGEIGEIVITDLSNYCFPFIRYRTGDMGCLPEYSGCKCGTTLPLLDNLEGRLFEVIKGLNGNSVSGTFWTLLFRYKVSGIQMFQVHQKKDFSIQVSLVTGLEYRKVESEQRLEFLIREKLGDLTQIHFDYDGHFRYTEGGGKYRWITSEIPRNE